MRSALNFASTGAGFIFFCMPGGFFFSRFFFFFFVNGSFFLMALFFFSFLFLTRPFLLFCFRPPSRHILADIFTPLCSPFSGASFGPGFVLNAQVWRLRGRPARRGRGWRGGRAGRRAAGQHARADPGARHGGDVSGSLGGVGSLVVAVWECGSLVVW
jgi:hypothetical protein